MINTEFEAVAPEAAAFDFCCRKWKVANRKASVTASGLPGLSKKEILCKMRVWDKQKKICGQTK
jgi:hypothetical protein